MLTNPRHYPSWLSLETCLNWEPLAAARGVSAVARSARGFMRAYERARGDRRRLASMKVPGKNRSWLDERDGFVARHLSQLRTNREPLWREDGTPTDRHLALIMWAYSPAGEDGLARRARRIAANPTELPHDTCPACGEWVAAGSLRALPIEGDFRPVCAPCWYDWHDSLFEVAFGGEEDDDLLSNPFGRH
jgi:hypothetical protein